MDSFPYELSERQVQIGHLQLNVVQIRDLDKAIDDLYEELLKEGEESWLENYCPYFGVLWDAATVLGRQIYRWGEGKLENKTVLEIGCGLGVPSMVAAKLGARVTAMDAHPHVKEFFLRNLERNSIREVTYLCQSWENSLSDSKFDWIVASDVLYEKPFVVPLANFISTHLKPGGVAWVADPSRPYFPPFVGCMSSLGFQESIYTFDGTGKGPKISCALFKRKFISNGG